MEGNSKLTPPASATPTDSKPESPQANDHIAHQAPSKLPPCDQCRRRKVKCQQSNQGSCDRCLQSSLTCTREIQRKKRGPKKGSGSVIAKLRGESEHGRVQETGLPPFNLQSLDMQLPGSRQRTYTNGSVNSSPLGSPIASQYSDYGPTTDPLNMPRSVPLGFGDEISTLSNGGFSYAGIQLPSAWQIADDQPLLQYPAQTSADGYLSVNDLAHQIFQEPIAMTDSAPYPQPSVTSAAIGRPNSIDAILTGSAPATVPSEAVSNASSPRPAHGPKYLYRSNSGQSQVEPRLMALASEIGVSAQLLSQCVKQWFRHIYPIHPILHEATFMKMLNKAEELSIQDKILVLSLCAVTVTHAAPPSDLTLQNKQDLGRELLRQCLHLRHTYEWIETATLTTIVSSFCLCITYFEIKQVRSHHFFLREAIGFAREMHADTARLTEDPIELICRRRMLALLFITERGCAILRNKPISMMRLPHIPKHYFDEHDEVVLAGFTSLCNLFSTLDEKFVQLWYANDPEEVLETSPIENVAAIQHELNKLSFANVRMTDIQKADVLITQQWLRLIFWQASMRQGLISSTATDEVFFYNYPIVIARDLCQVMRGMEYAAILVHGLGIFEKVFEVSVHSLYHQCLFTDRLSISYTLMDALTLVKVDWATSNDLRYLFGCLSASPNSHSTYVKVLENKINLEKSGARNPANPTGETFGR
ncbi:hypothetical protein OHC33_009837 [Knufia fluminis]|uniref:Zn(2)-C6 fungal-type domain-containing protein n=1 Tax=Knufia fluminis TaxID=191047 RepID=A0AAN8EKX2_9EURO|nr:hypothetical protein OHC33_009837 [Knufia fluminis]